MTNDNNKLGADAPGESKSFVWRSAEKEAANVASAPAGGGAHRIASDPQKRQAEAVVDPHLDEAAPRSTTKTLISVLPPEAVVRLVLSAGRMARKQNKPLPPNIAERLGEALARGDAAAPALRDWAIRIGVLADGSGLTLAGSRYTDPGLAGCDRVTEHDHATLRAVALARHLRERLSMNRPSLQAKVERETSRGSRPATLCDTCDASPSVDDNTGRRS